MQAHARGTLSGLLGLVLFACGGKTENRSDGIAHGTGGSGGVVSVASSGAHGGAAASSGGAPVFIRIDAGAPTPQMDGQSCSARVALVYGGDVASCTWKIPERWGGSSFNPLRVNLETESNAEPTSLYHVSTPSECGETENTWFYDDEKSPTSLALCPRACDKYLSSPGARIYFAVGCSWGGGPMH